MNMAIQDQNPSVLNRPNFSCSLVVGFIASVMLSQSAFGDPVTYHPDLTNTPLTDGNGVQGTTEISTIDNAENWEYYRFCANVDAMVDIEVHRTTEVMDPAAMVCQGTTFDSTGIQSGWTHPPSCGASMGPVMSYEDDNNGIPHGVGGRQLDPKLSFVAPSGPAPNAFTLMVFSLYGTGGDYHDYEIHVNGVSPCLISVLIDIKPGNDAPNPVNTGSKGVIPVAILTTPEFDATQVDDATLAFGPSGAVIAHKQGHIEDVDGDGDDDLVVHFRTQETGIECGNTEATLTGATLFDGIPISGTDSIHTVGKSCE
jgi:hypothetical protein